MWLRTTEIYSANSLRIQQRSRFRSTRTIPTQRQSPLSVRFFSVNVKRLSQFAAVKAKFYKSEDKMTSAREHAFSKVPEVTLIFWLIKIAATTLGETAGDA